MMGVGTGRGKGVKICQIHIMSPNLPLFRLPPALPSRCLSAQSQLGTLPVTLTTYYAQLHSIQIPFSFPFCKLFFRTLFARSQNACLASSLLILS